MTKPMDKYQRHRMKKKANGYNKTAVWVPSGTEEQIKELARKLRERYERKGEESGDV